MFLSIFAIYFAAACYLALVANVVYGDTMARSENAQRVLLSRDPHLAAIGFVWNPLPIFALLPLVPLKFLWPQLTNLGLAADFVSALCMSGAVIQVRGMLAEVGLGRRITLLLTSAFALHPLILVFAANGMSEAMLLLFLLMTVRYLARWLRDFDVNSLITTGFGLALAYLTRYEALAAALGVIFVVAAASLVRSRRQGGRVSSVVADVAIVAAPVTMAFVVWALASWLITGHPFERFASVYDNRTIVQTGYAKWSRALLDFTSSQVAWLELALPALLIFCALTRAWYRHLSLMLAGMGSLGATLAFMVLAEFNGSIPNELRYLIVVVPIAVVLAGTVAASATQSPGRRSHLEGAVGFAGVLCVLSAVPISALGILDNRVNPDSALYVQSTFSSKADPQVGGSLNWTTERKVAADLDHLNLPPGTVLLDDYLGSAIVVSSNNPRQFVITSDRDFRSVLADPAGTGMRFILVPQPGDLGNLDALNRRYPGLFEGGAGFATLVREYVKHGVNDTNWRLYRIN